MEIYSQLDGAWSGLPLGNSGCRCGGYGCTVCTVAQALTLAGWSVTPKDLIEGLNLNGGFDENGYLKWYFVGKLYPQFHFYTNGQQGAYKFCQGSIGQYTHWILQKGSTYYDPLKGSTNLALSGVNNIHCYWSADIDINNNPAPVIVEASAPVVHPSGSSVFTVRIDSPVGRSVHIGRPSVTAPIAVSRFLHTNDTLLIARTIVGDNPYPNTFLSSPLWYLTEQSVLDNAQDNNTPLRYIWAGETTILQDTQTN